MEKIANNTNDPNNKLSKEQKIRKCLDNQLAKENQERYSDFLSSRIDENRKSMSRLSITLLLCYFAFPLIVESKISDISFGPFKLSDNLIALGIIPSVFAFVYYKYITVWIDLVEQKMTFRILTSKIFSIEKKSFLNQKLWPHSFLDSIMMYHLEEKSIILGCLTMFFWVPIGLIILIFPFAFEYYMISTIYEKFGYDTFIKKVILITPILIGVFTLLIIFQVAKRDFDEKKYNSK